MWGEPGRLFVKDPLDHTKAGQKSQEGEPIPVINTFGKGDSSDRLD